MVKIEYLGPFACRWYTPSFPIYLSIFPSHSSESWSIPRFHQNCIDLIEAHRACCSLLRVTLSTFQFLPTVSLTFVPTLSGDPWYAQSCCSIRLSLTLWKLCLPSFSFRMILKSNIQKQKRNFFCITWVISFYGNSKGLYIPKFLTH